MHAFRPSPLSVLVWVLSILQITATPAGNDSLSQLEARQASGAMSPTCMEYSMIANYSTISANSSYRAAFQQAAPMGTFMSNDIIDGAAARLPEFIMNKAINDECGNLTDIALTGAATNFTQNIVADFVITPAPETLSNSVGMVFVACLGILSITVLGSVV